MAINILDFQVANLIAAGEVVDRPASVVKELMENAIDAGASEVEIEIRRGGVSYIRVTDNGSGMTREDAEVCILRHATSKIKDAGDLDSIITLGFRGEALAAISSVSQMTITTKTAKDSVGTMVICDCGRITEVNEAGCKKGTTIVVRELFANVPARRKFLKRDQSEGMAVAAVVEKGALSHPEISFKMLSDGAVRLQTAGDKKLYNAIYALLGRDFASKMIMVKSRSEAVEVFGYIGRPDNARANRNYQNFFINGRYVKSRTATAALEQAFSSFMESERFPCCVLNILLHPSFVDVNVHPTKLEVKFSSEKTVFDAIYLACRNALLTDTVKPEMIIEKKDIDEKAISTYNRFVPVYDRIDKPMHEQTKLFDRRALSEGKEQKVNSVPQIPFDDLPFVFEDIAKKADEALKKEEEQGVPSVQVKEEHFAVPHQEESGTASKPIRRLPDSWSVVPQTSAVCKEVNSSLLKEEHLQKNDGTAEDLLKDGLSSSEKAENLLQEELSLSEKKEENIFQEPVLQESDPVLKNELETVASEVGEKHEPEFKLLGIAFETYILAEVGDKLLMIDKHAAHERLLFEKMKENMYSSDNRFVQILLLPETVHVGTAEKAAVLEYEEELKKAGYLFSFDPGDDQVRITGIPGILEEDQALALFLEMITELASGGGNAEVSRQIAFEKRLFTASCKAAMKGSRHDGDEHLNYLVKELLRLPDIRYCPHGRPVAFEIPKGSIEHRFKRS